MNNYWKEKVERGEKTVGTFIGSGDNLITEAGALSKMDFFIIDTEHGPFDVETSAECIRTIEMYDKTAMVRVKDANRNSILKMLDVGAKALIIPQIHDIEEVKKVVEYGKYFPVGDRGVMYGRAVSFGYDECCSSSLTDYFDVCNRETMLLPQCETTGALAQIEEIVALDGVDGIFIGPFDLSVSMGIPGGFGKPEFQEALVRIKKACDDAGKPCIMFGLTTASAKGYADAGFEHLCISINQNIYHDALDAVVDAILE